MPWARWPIFQCPKPIPPANLPRALNNILPPDIMICSAVEVEADFHARISAQSKRYRYLLAADQANPFTAGYFWPQKKLPDIERMQEAANLLLGQHDFRHFTLANATVSNFVRTISKLHFYVPNQAELPVYLQNPLALEACADGFLYKMVRLIIARLVAVGQGLLEPAAMLQFLQGAEPLQLPPAPPQGLMLMQVYYAE